MAQDTQDQQQEQLGNADRQPEFANSKKQLMTDQELDDLAAMIAFNPTLRDGYLARPGRIIARHIPLQGPLERSLMLGSQERRNLRARLASRIEAKISGDGRLVSIRAAFNERQTFLKEALRNPQRAFDTMLWMNIASFGIGVGFIVVAFIAGFFIDDTVQQGTAAGLSGLAGVVTTLGTVYRMTQRGVRRISGDNAQIRVILHEYATEVAHLRGISIDNLEEAESVARQLRQAKVDALSQIERYVEPPAEPAGGETPTAGGPVAPTGTGNLIPLDGGRAPRLA